MPKIIVSDAPGFTVLSKGWSHWLWAWSEQGPLHERSVLHWAPAVNARDAISCKLWPETSPSVHLVTGLHFQSPKGHLRSCPKWSWHGHHIWCCMVSVVPGLIVSVQYYCTGVLLGLHIQWYLLGGYSDSQSMGTICQVQGQQQWKGPKALESWGYHQHWH